MSPLEIAGLVLVGAVANGINSVAGGGSLISFPYLMIVNRFPSDIANATNSVSLWPGSLSALFGFRNLIPQVKHYMKLLAIPTIVGAVAGSYLFAFTSTQVFDIIVPFLILLASLLLFFQPQIKARVLKSDRVFRPSLGVVLQFFVAVYGGYFGAGMGIMMLAAFALYMEGTIHELNAVKTFLGTFINLAATFVFIQRGLVNFEVAAPLIVGSIIGGFAAAKLSQKVNPEKMRITIAYYGLVMAGYYFLKLFKIA